MNSEEVGRARNGKFGARKHWSGRSHAEVGRASPGGRHAGRALLMLVVAAVVACWSASSTLAAVPTTEAPIFGGGPALAPPLKAAGTAAPLAASSAQGFFDSTAIDSLLHPTVVRFASDGRVFVAEKSGLIKVFQSLSDTHPTVAADLRTQVDDNWDRGLLGLALDPNFPTNPYIYALYTFDAPIGGTAPVWNDACPTPPGSNTDGCVVSGRLVRIQLAGNVMTGTPQTLITDWCQQYPSHSIGALNFGPDGALYVSGGDGASFSFADYGQGGGSAGSPTPKNPCGDPPAGVGGTQTPPTAEGGALRAQSLRRPAGEPAVLNGTVLRVDPATGLGLPDNPGASSTDANTRRVVAYGMRNPFRFTFRPGTSELWIGDVGWGTSEEINRRPTPTGPVQNFGWPCYEGSVPQSGYQSANLNLCTSLYSTGTATAPYYAYDHSSTVVPGETCPTVNGSSITGVAFYSGGSYPSSFNGGLFFADHTRNCIWAMPTGANGLPDPTKLQTIVAGASNPIDIVAGPGGDLFYVDFEGGTIRRIQYGTPPPPPTYLSDLSWTSMTNGWGPVEKDMSNGEAAAGDGGPITMNGQVFAKGLGAHAASDVRYSLGSSCTRFKATVGIDDEKRPNGSVAFQVYADATKVYDSGVVTGTSANQSVDVSVAGASELRLVVTDGGDGIAYDHADWAGARLECGGPPPPPPSSTYVSDLSWTSMTNGWGPVEKDMSNGEAAAGDGRPLSINGQVFAKGLGAHAASDVRYNVGGACTRFKATVGIDDEKRPNGSVAFQVYADATKVYDSGVVTGASAVQNVDVSIAGASELRLVVTDGGDGFAYDHADWADARVECGTQPPTVSSTTPANGATGVAATVRPTATFSSSMDATTLTTSTFTLVKQGTTTPVAATVSYDGSSRTATLTPSASLAGNSTYTATVKGGTGGVKDAAGTPMATDTSWSFGTAAPNTPPTPVIDSPSATLTWAVGDPIAFSGHAADAEDGTLAASALSWALIVHHCPTTPDACHTHPIQTFNGVAAGSVNGPDHEYPAWLELQLTATDSAGASATTSVRLDPKTVGLNFASVPSGLSLTVGSTSSVTPFARTVMVNSINSMSASSPQTLGGTSYSFASWSDGGAATHNITAPTSAATYTATYAATPPTTSTYVSDLTWTSMTNGWGPVEKDRSNGEAAAGDGRPITMNGQVFAKGLGAHAASDVRYNLSGACTRFKASVGIDDEKRPNGSVAFQVYADATKVYDSGVVTGTSAAKSVDVSTAGATELRLVVTDGGDGFSYDHADWADARVECGPPVNSAPPTISGSATRGSKLTTTNGTWSGAGPITYQYRWRRCNSAGSACADISGATASTYTLVAADVGFRIRSRVTATNSRGSTPADSAATAVVR
jgi:glucose/arabinose dehydrogenase/uncharacterized protein (DUF2141 family)